MSPRRTRLVIVGAMLAMITMAGMAIASRSPYAPQQPINFRHRDHVATDRLACGLCHSGARRAAFAGMPPVERCMGCHRFVLPDAPGVLALRRYWDAGKTIPWVKVYSLPRFVRFS